MSKAWPGACYWNDSMNRMSLAALLSCLPLVAWADNPVKLDTPVSGWRAGDGSAANYRQVVNYPASSVNVAADQATTARIRGAIESQPKDRPATLVVNGVSMPLKVDADVSFDRPFAFPSGSNSVEVRNAAGQSRRVQFYHGGGGGEVPAKLRVLLSWDSAHVALNREDLQMSLALAMPYMGQLHLANAVLEREDPQFGDWHMPMGQPGFLTEETAYAIGSCAVLHLNEGEHLGITVESRCTSEHEIWEREDQNRSFLERVLEREVCL